MTATDTRTTDNRLSAVVGSATSFRRRQIVRRTLASVVAAFAFVLLALPAVAIDDITIPLTTVVRGAEGESFLLAEVPTGGEAGCEAVVSATAHNNESVHLGNDLIVASGGNQVVLVDVESATGKVTTADGTLVLGDTITVTLVLGQADEGRPRSVFSGGATVTVSCIPEETTTTRSPKRPRQPKPPPQQPRPPPRPRFPRRPPPRCRRSLRAAYSEPPPRHCPSPRAACWEHRPPPSRP